MRALKMRPPTEEEKKVIEKLAASRTAPAVQVRRAQLLKHLAQGASAPKAAAAVGGVTGETVRHLLKRFNEEGLETLEDRHRSGRRPAFTEEDRGQLLLLAKRQPKEVLGEAKAACHWTLETFLAAAHKEGLSIGKTHLWRVLNQEGIRWWQQTRSWLSSDDPEYPQKRGRLWASTRTRRREAP
jgi:transposase